MLATVWKAKKEKFSFFFLLLLQREILTAQLDQYVHSYVVGSGLQARGHGEA